MSIVTEKTVTQLETQELETLRGIQSKTQALIQELGEIELSKIQIEARHANAKEFLAKLQEEETTFTNSLSEKYGKCSINPETGEITQMD